MRPKVRSPPIADIQLSGFARSSFTSMQFRFRCRRASLLLASIRCDQASMLLTPEMCRAARALLAWKTSQLASAARLGLATVRRFETGGMVRPSSVEAMLQALQGAGLEFIPAGGKSLDGGPGLRTLPMAEPEVIAAEEAAEFDELTLRRSNQEAQ